MREAGRIDRVLGEAHGIQGVLRNRVVALGGESRTPFEAAALTLCSAPRFVRKKACEAGREHVPFGPARIDA